MEFLWNLPGFSGSPEEEKSREKPYYFHDNPSLSAFFCIDQNSEKSLWADYPILKTVAGNRTNPNPLFADKPERKYEMLNLNYPELFILLILNEFCNEKS